MGDGVVVSYGLDPTTKDPYNLRRDQSRVRWTLTRGFHLRHKGWSELKGGESHGKYEGKDRS